MLSREYSQAGIAEEEVLKELRKIADSLNAGGYQRWDDFMDDIGCSGVGEKMMQKVMLELGSKGLLPFGNKAIHSSQLGKGQRRSLRQKKQARSKNAEKGKNK